MAVDKEEEEGDNTEEDGVLVYEAKDQVEKGPPAFGKEKHEWEEPPGMSRSSTRDVHRYLGGLLYILSPSFSSFRIFLIPSGPF